MSDDLADDVPDVTDVEAADDLDDVDVAVDVEDVLVLNELVLPVWEPTGQPAVDAALDRLTVLNVDDLSSQAEVFDLVHRELRQVLADLDG